MVSSGLRFACSAVALAASATVGAQTAAQPVRFDVSAIDVQGNTLLTAEQILAVVSPYMGTQRSLADLQQAAQALRQRYAEAGHPVVQVVAPAQTVTGGKVTLQVVEDKVTAINVTGNKQYNTANILASLPALQVGQSLNAPAVEAAILLANENAAKQVALNVQPGNRPGDVTTTVQVTEDRVSKWTATYDNTGAENTGVNKIGLIWQHANLFDRDHALTLQYNGTTENIDKVYSFSAGYHVPLYDQGVSLDLIAAYSSSSGQNVNLYFSGKGTVLGARVNVPLRSWGALHQRLTLGVDAKDSQSVSGPLTTPISETPLSLAYGAQWAHPSHQGSLGLTYLSNLRGGSNGNDTDYYNPATGLGARAPLAGPASAALPSADWSLWRFNANAAANLPGDWQARATLNLQRSSHLLLPSEQFGVGGVGSVRGYPDRIAAGDKGHSINLEAYTPDLGKALGWPDTSLRALLFWDLGQVSLNDQPVPAGVSATTAVEGIGLGLRLTYGKNVSIKWDTGWARKPAGALPTLVRVGDTYSAVAVAVSF